MSEPYVPGVSGSSGFVCHYPGDVAADVMAQRHLLGPDLDPKRNQRYAPVAAVFDPSTGRTTVQLQPVPRGESGPALPALPPMTRQQRRQYERVGRKAMKKRGTASR